jgi:hypothetical protein
MPRDRCVVAQSTSTAPLTPKATPLSMPARFKTAQRAGFVVAVLIQQHMAVWTKVLLGCHAGARELEKAHHTLLTRGPQELLSGWLFVSQHSKSAYEDKVDVFPLMVDLSLLTR